MTDFNTALLKSSEIDRASKILVRAFSEDPMFRYLGIEIKPGQSKVDIDILQWFCNFNLRNLQLYNHIYTTPGDLKGVAAWVPPEKSEMNTWKTLSMLLVLFYKCGWQRTKRSLSLFSTLNKRHQEDMTEPHWMLSLIGVEPTHQGEGIGSLLLQPIFKKADRQGLSCYLSTFSEQAVNFYQKHGFIILWQGELSDDSPRIWTMKRKPQTVDI